MPNDLPPLYVKLTSAGMARGAALALCETLNGMDKRGVTLTADHYDGVPIYTTKTADGAECTVSFNPETNEWEVPAL